MINVNGIKFEKTVTRPYPPLFHSLSFKGMSDKKNWNNFLWFPYGLDGFLDINSDIYYSHTHLHDLPLKIVAGLFKDKKKFLQLKRDTLRREAELLKARNGDWQSFFKAQIGYMTTLALYHICDDVIEQGIKKELLKKISLAATEKLMAEINIPIKDNFDKKKNLEILRNGVDSFLKKYSWFYFRYYRYGLYPRKDAEKLLGSLKKEHYFDHYQQEKEKLKRSLALAKRLLGEKAYYLDIMQFFIYYRTQRTDMLNKTVYEFHDKLVKLSDDLGLSYQELVHCTFEEIVSKNFPSRQVLQDRSVGYIFIGARGKYQILSGRQSGEFLKTLPEQETEGDKLSGRSIFFGQASGRVKIIKNNNDLKNIVVGDVLVTNMTTPNMTPTMKKAAAFVTDEGGITCHAAILAREMKKPCIVGTKIATKVLRDGDLVEVDANQGIVKVLKRNKK